MEESSFFRLTIEAVGFDLLMRYSCSVTSKHNNPDMGRIMCHIFAYVGRYVRPTVCTRNRNVDLHVSNCFPKKGSVRRHRTEASIGGSYKTPGPISAFQTNPTLQSVSTASMQMPRTLE